MNLTILFLIAAVLIVVIYSLSTKKLVIEKKEIVKIGFIADLASGGNTTKNAFEAAKIAIDDANKLYNKKFELVVYDIKENDKNAIANAYTLASKDNAAAVITLINPKSLPSEKELPTIYVGNVKSESIERKKFYWNIRLFFIESDYVDQHLQAIKSKYKIATAAFVTDKKKWLDENFTNNIGSLQGIKTDKYLFDSPNTKTLAKAIKEKNPDVVMLLMKDLNAIKFLKASKGEGMDDKLFLGFAATNVSFLAEQESLPKRFILAPPPDDTVGPMENWKHPFGLFSKKLFYLTGKRARNLELNSYDAVSILADAIAKSNIDNKPETIKDDREKIMKELWATTGFKSLKGILAPNGKTGYFERRLVNTYYINNLKFMPARDVIV